MFASLYAYIIILSFAASAAAGFTAAKRVLWPRRLPVDVQRKKLSSCELLAAGVYPISLVDKTRIGRAHESSGRVQTARSAHLWTHVRIRYNIFYLHAYIALL